MEFREVILSRKSIRSLSDKEVEDEKFTKTFEAARLAPSWANKQCWSYILIRDKNKKNPGYSRSNQGSCFNSNRLSN